MIRMLDIPYLGRNSARQVLCSKENKLFPMGGKQLIYSYYNEQLKAPTGERKKYVDLIRRELVSLRQRNKAILNTTKDADALFFLKELITYFKGLEKNSVHRKMVYCEVDWEKRTIVRRIKDFLFPESKKRKAPKNIEELISPDFLDKALPYLSTSSL